MGEMRRQEERYSEEYERLNRLKSTVALGACLIAAVRTVRETAISSDNPRVDQAVTDSVRLAKMVVLRATR